jgi:hypothetical protein
MCEDREKCFLANEEKMFRDAAFRDIEEVWSKLSGKPLRPMDWAFLETFFEARISVEEICDGIETSFRRFRPKFPGDRIRSLSYCAPAICERARQL